VNFKSFGFSDVRSRVKKFTAENAEERRENSYLGSGLIVPIVDLALEHYMFRTTLFSYFSNLEGVDEFHLVLAIMDIRADISIQRIRISKVLQNRQIVGKGIQRLNLNPFVIGASDRS
jgi:hypothetical protein